MAHCILYMIYLCYYWRVKVFFAASEGEAKLITLKIALSLVNLVEVLKSH